jgi:transposase-like protein
MYTVPVVEWVAFMYLRSLSFNQVIAILKARYEKDIFTKDRLINHLEKLSDRLPDHLAISTWLTPRRSGYYALDGTWLKYRGRDIVLLILFDCKTLDVVSYTVAQEETAQSYQRLIEMALPEISANIKGIHCDGDPGLLRAVRHFFPNVPIQLCVFHKYARAGQLIPFIRIKNKIDKEIKEKTQNVLFAPSKNEAILALQDLERYAREHQSHKKLQMLIGVLKRNFDLLLTHFDNPDMSPYNNVLEGFNYIIKRRTKLMKGFKKPININRWLKLIIIDWRFHPLTESAFKDRRNPRK